MHLKDLTENIEAIEITGATDKDIKGIAYDSRKVRSGFLFVALRGSNADGHNFINAAIEKGAVAVICEEMREEYSKHNDITFILVSNTRLELAFVSDAFYNHPTEAMKIIGVTGTNGKTTTTYLIKSILEYQRIPCGLIGTTGIMSGPLLIPATHTTPESLELSYIFEQMVNMGIEAVLMEVSSHALDQNRVAAIDFDIALFTNLTPDHLDYHKNMQDYATAKKIFFDNLKPEALAVVFDNSEYTKYITQDCRAYLVFIGRNPEDDLVITDEELSLYGANFTLKSNISDLPDLKITTRLSGSFNIDNAALAAAATYIAGIDAETIKAALAYAQGAPGRMQSLQLQNGALAIVDYAHTPDALEKALSSCREILDSSAKDGKLISVFGCGGDRDKTKRPVMGGISSRIADFTVITSDNPRTENPDTIISEIYGGVPSGVKDNVIIIPDRAEAINLAIKHAMPDDIVLVAGKGHEDYQIIGTEKHHFDDTEEIRKAAGLDE